jgi:transposase
VASRSAMQRFCQALGIRSYRPTYRFLRGDPVKQGEAREELAGLREKAEAGELVLLSQDEARVPMVPTLGPTLGVKGQRPTVGTRDCKDLLYVLGVVDVVTGALHANTLESPTRAKQVTGKSKTRRLQEAFAAHLRHVARLYPRREHKRVVLILDNAPWHRGGPIDETLAEHPHLEFKRLPSYSPQLNVIERFWKLLRRQATHNRLFDSLADLKRSLRSSLCYYQTMRKRMKRLIAGCYARPENQNVSVGL